MWCMYSYHMAQESDTIVNFKPNYSYYTIIHTQDDFIDKTSIKISTASLTEGLFAAAAILISFQAVLGKLTTFQLTLMAIFGTIL
jgi:hypothetical protein